MSVVTGSIHSIICAQLIDCHHHNNVRMLISRLCYCVQLYSANNTVGWWSSLSIVGRVLSSVVSYELFRSMSFVVLAYCFNPENMIAGGSIDRRGVCVKGGHLCVLAEACIVLLVVHILYIIM